MPRVSTEIIRYTADGHEDHFRVDVSVDTSGVFYARPRDDVFELIQRDRQLRQQLDLGLGDGRKAQGTVTARTMNELLIGLRQALILVNQPTVTSQLVIRYLLESRVSFAEQPDGTIVPSTAWKDARWPDTTPYGKLHAQNQSHGYSMHIGAEAMTKKQTVYGGGKPILSYEYYYGTGDDGRPLSHHERQHPAGLLNSWVSFSLPDKCPEMPYTDEAALWFHQLMLRMAYMQRSIQQMLADQQRFIELVNNGLRLPFGG